MIKQVSVINDRGEVLDMVLKSPEKSGLNITDISGIGPEGINVNIDDSLNIDGGIYNSSKKPVRNIVFSIKFMDYPSVEDNRHKTYKFFPFKKEITLIFLTDTRKLYISGIVESNTPNIFSKEESCQISILCPDPYFRSTEKIENTSFYMDNVISGFTFPVSSDNFTFANLDSEYGYKNIINFGNMDSKILITLDGLISIPESVPEVSHQTYWINHDIIIKNLTTNQELRMRLDDSFIVYRHTKIYISSEINNKFVWFENAADLNTDEDISFNGIKYLNKNSDWIYLIPGNNLFYSNVPIWIESDTAQDPSTCGVMISYTPLFEGV